MILLKKSNIYLCLPLYQYASYDEQEFLCIIGVFDRQSDAISILNQNIKIDKEYNYKMNYAVVPFRTNVIDTNFRFRPNSF